VATLFLGGLGVMNVMSSPSANGRVKSVSAKRSAHARIHPQAIFSRDRHRCGLERRHGAAAVLRFLRAGESAAHAAVFLPVCSPNWKLGALSIFLLGLIAVLSALYPANRAASVDLLF